MKHDMLIVTRILRSGASVEFGGVAAMKAMGYPPYASGDDVVCVIDMDMALGRYHEFKDEEPFVGVGRTAPEALSRALSALKEHVAEHGGTGWIE